MGGVTKAIKFLLIGDSKSAEKALQNVSRGFKDTAKSGGGIKGLGRDLMQAVKSGQGMKGVGGVLKNAAKEAGGLGGIAKGAALGLAGLAAAGIAAGAAIAIKFGRDSVDTFKRVATEVKGLKRVTGMTTEDASRLAFQFTNTGINAAKGSAGMKLFEKNLGTAADGGKKAAAMTKLLGFSFTDAHGKVLPMSKLIPQVADKFASMPDGPQKTALAMKLFGKSGADMLPFLNKGAKGLDDLAKKSDKFGNTLTDKQLDALNKSKQAQKDWDAAMQGLQVTLGGALLPALTEMATAINSAAIPAMQGIGEWITKNQGLFDGLGKAMRWVWNNVLLPLVKYGIWGMAQWAESTGHVIAAIGHLSGNKDMEDFGNSVVQAAKDTENWALSLEAIPDHVAPKIDPKVEQAKVKLSQVDAKIKGLKDKIVTAKAKGDDKGLRDLEKQLKAAEKKRHDLNVTIRASVDSSSDVIKLNMTRGGHTGVLRMYAQGGIERHTPQIVRGGDVRVWGEKETRGEAYIPFANDHRRPRAIAIWQQTGRELGVYANGGIRGGRWGGGGVRDVRVQIDVHVPLGADKHGAAREVRTALVELFQDTGLKVP